MRRSKLTRQNVDVRSAVALGVALEERGVDDGELRNEAGVAASSA